MGSTTSTSQSASTSQSSSSNQSACSSVCGSSSDPTIARDIEHVTHNLCQIWVSRNFLLKEIKLYSRAVKGCSEAEGAAVGGMCHTFIVIETDSDSYILERLLEGVRLSNVTASLHEVTKDAYKWSHSEVPLSSKAVAKWVLSESNVDYNLFTNNCIHFVKDFGRMFTREDDFRMNFVEFAKFVISQMPTVIVEGGTKDEKNCLLTTY